MYSLTLRNHFHSVSVLEKDYGKRKFLYYRFSNIYKRQFPYFIEAFIMNYCTYIKRNSDDV